MSEPESARTCRTTLEVRVESADAFFDRVEDAVSDLDEAGYDTGTPARGLALPDEAALARVFSVRNLELVRAIAGHEPSSMRELAKIVDRDIKNVSENLNELEALGLVDLISEGRARRPVVPYDEIEVVYPVRDGGDATGAGESSADD